MSANPDRADARAGAVFNDLDSRVTWAERHADGRRKNTLAVRVADLRALLARLARLEAALRDIASMGGKCLLGEGNYRAASAEAFNQAAGVARAALDAPHDDTHDGREPGKGGA